MTKSADDIRRFFNGAGLSTHPDIHERIFADVLRAHRRTTAHLPAQPEIWRFAMRHPITKYAFAAVVVLAAIVGLTIYSRTGSVTWALDQSIEALSKYKAVFMEGWDTERTWKEDGDLEPKPSKSWAVANEAQTMIEKFRTEVDGVPILVTNGQKTWRYDAGTGTVRVEDRPYVASECWLGSRFFEQLKAFLESGTLTRCEMTHGKDSATGRQRMFLTCAWEDGRFNGPRSMWLAFDSETKLPVGFKQWENSGWEGPPSLIVEKFTYYESLPDSLFEFELPPGATVVEQ